MLGIKYISPLDNTGYGLAARAYLKGLIRNGIPVTWTPLVHGRSLGLGYEPLRQRFDGEEILAQICNRDIPYDTVIMHLVPEYYPHFIQQEQGKLIIGYTVWETDRIPRHWQALLNQCHKILVPSHFSREVFLEGGITSPIDVVPHISVYIQPAASDFLGKIDPQCCVFYTISDWIARKANELTIQVYLRAFTSSDNCLLVVKTGKYDLAHTRWKKFFFSTSRLISRLQARHANPSKIKLISEVLSDAQIQALHRRGDCYVSLTRSEGWGLGAFDAAAAGKPVIITGYGGQVEYLPDDLAYLVKFKMVPVAANAIWRSYTTDQHWAEPDLDDAVRLLQLVKEHPAEARHKGNLLKSLISENYSEQVVIRKMLDSIQSMEESSVWSASGGQR